MVDQQDPTAGSVLPGTTPVIKPVLLAAGASRRLGRAKQLVCVGGTPLIAHAAAAVVDAHPSLLPASVVVSSHLRRTIADALTPFALLVDNPCAQEGMASSVRLAAAIARDAQADALLLVLSDQPLVDSACLGRLLLAFHGRPTQPAASRYGKVRAGVPAIIPRSLFPELASLQGDQGARGVLGASTTTVVEMPEAALDVDHPQDIERLRALWPDRP